MIVPSPEHSFMRGVMKPYFPARCLDVPCYLNKTNNNYDIY